MKILKVDDKGRAACDTCAAIVDVTFRLRNVPLSDGSGIVENVLVGVCDQCDNVCVLPHQSVPQVALLIEKQRKAVDSRVPAHMIDILNLASRQVGGGADFGSQLIKYYIHALARKEISPTRLASYLKSDLARGKAQMRISLKGRHVFEEIQEVKASAQLNTTSELIKSVILKINDDVLQKKSKKPIKALEGIVAACQ